jgi:hypothetical protein
MPLPRIPLPLSRLTFPKPPDPALHPALGPATAPGPILVVFEVPSFVVQAARQSGAIAERIFKAFMG